MSDLAKDVTQQLMDDGKLVETGWLAYSRAVGSQAREAFFMGAYHIFSSLFLAADETSEITADDERRVDQLYAEMLPFGKSMQDKYQANNNDEQGPLTVLAGTGAA